MSAYTYGDPFTVNPGVNIPATFPSFVHVMEMPMSHGASHVAGVTSRLVATMLTMSSTRVTFSVSSL